MTRKSKHVKSKRRTTRRNKTRRTYKRQDKTRRRKKGGARIARSIKNVAGKTTETLKRGVRSVSDKFKKNVSEDDKNRTIAIFTHTRDKLRELFSITHNPFYDKEPFDPLDPFPANELDINNDFIKRLLVNTLCYANLPDKYKKAFKQMVLERYQNNTQYFKEFYYRAFLDIKRLLPGTEEIHPFPEFNYCGPGTDVLWRLTNEFVWMKRLLDHSLGRKEIGTYPYNEPIPGVADSCCKVHDLMFGIQYIDGFDEENGHFTSNSKESELIADKAMLECIKKKKNRGEKLTIKDKTILNTIRVKHNIQKVGADPRTGKLGDKAFDKLIFSDAVNPEAPVDPRYKGNIKRMLPLY
jgi:hypothetical protein